MENGTTGTLPQALGTASGPSPDPLEFARRFRDSMPTSYRRAYPWAAVQEHAAIASRRAGRIAHLEMWRVRLGPVVLVATDDRTGGLAVMSAAIAAAGFDILMAEAYRRNAIEGPAEAIYLFELRHPHDQGAPLELQPIIQSLESMLRDGTPAQDILRRKGPTLRPGTQASPEVTFADDDEASILLVEARDRPGLLATITRALIEVGVCIVDSEIVTVDGRARDRFQLTEPNGKPLEELRRLAVANCVSTAIDNATF